MRKSRIQVRYIPQQRFNDIALACNMTLSYPRKETPLYVQIRPKLMLRESRHLRNMFISQYDEVNGIWVPGHHPKGEAAKQFRERGRDPTYYDELFERAIKHGRLVVAYNSDEARRLRSGEVIKLRDDFTFRRDGTSFTLTQFSIRGKNFNQYFFDPSVPKRESWRERMLGIREFMEE